MSDISKRGAEKRFKTTMDVRIHGTYAWDDGDAWKIVERKVSTSRAREMAKVPNDIIVSDHSPDYLWLNKGWIVLDHANEDMPGDKPSVGQRALYLHDGRYYLLERVK